MNPAPVWAAFNIVRDGSAKRKCTLLEMIFNLLPKFKVAMTIGFSVNCLHFNLPGEHVTALNDEERQEPDSN